MSAAPPPFGNVLDALCAVGRSMRETFDPHRLLNEFSSQLAPLVPHDRLVVDVLEEDGRAFTVFAEHVVRGPRLHETHYTASLGRERYPVAEWAIRPVFAGDTMLVADVATDPQFVDGNPYERQLVAEGVRSALGVPVPSGGGVIGTLVATSMTPGAYTDAHVEAARRVAELIGPLIDGTVLLERQRRRRAGAHAGARLEPRRARRLRPARGRRAARPRRGHRRPRPRAGSTSSPPTPSAVWSSSSPAGRCSASARSAGGRVERQRDDHRHPDGRHLDVDDGRLRDERWHRDAG